MTFKSTEIRVAGSVLIAYHLAAVFALAAVVPLVAKPIHFERTFALGLSGDRRGALRQHQKPCQGVRWELFPRH